LPNAFPADNTYAGGQQVATVLALRTVGFFGKEPTVDSNAESTVAIRLEEEARAMAMRLLVVDDDQDVLNVIKNLLQSFGYGVLALADSREAAARVNRQKFDGAFIDARMPHLDGLALTRHIRSSPSNSSIPIFMLTGYDDVDSMRAGFRVGITFSLSKPLDVYQLRGLLTQMHGAMLREKRSYVRLLLRTVVLCRAGEHQFTSASVNLSEGGMLLETSGGLEEGQEVELQFSLPTSGELLNPRTRVVRKEPPDRIAVRFTELAPEERQAIQAYIAGIIRE
jgi:CheY-like chemotaxis protein